MAGNLQIAASTFIGLGLILAVVLQLLALLMMPAGSNHRDPGETVVVEESATESRSKKHHPHASHNTHAGHTRPVTRRSTRILTGGLVLSLLLGAVLQLLAQFFGVLSLSVLATPTATVVNTIAPRGFTNFAASDWMLDIGMTRYASVAWAFSLAGAGLAGSLLFLGRRV
jgi:hypothetical protein